MDTLTTASQVRRMTVLLTVAVVFAPCGLSLLVPPGAQAAVATPLGYVLEIGCSGSNDTSAWNTASNGGDFGIVGECPGLNLTTYPVGLSLGGGSAADGQYASWYTSVPAGMQISSAVVTAYFARGLTAGGWAGDWKVGGQTIPLANTTNLPGELGSQGFFGGSSPSATGTLFGWSIQCRSPSGCSNNGDLIQVGDVRIEAQETQGPTMSAPTGLWASSAYVWGNWTVAVTANGPSGVCDLSASLDGQALPGATSGTPNQAVWDQCGPARFSQTVDIANGTYGEGGVPLVFTDQDAAGWGGPVQKTVYIDDIPPKISLSGPVDASVAAGTQYITATATTTGRSGVKGISCAVDGAPAQWYPGASANVPVSGLGAHRLSCVSESNSYNSSGQANTSTTPATWTLTIRQPSVSTASFARIRLMCRLVRVRERIPAHMVKVRRHHKVGWVKRRARMVVHHVKRCHVRSMVLERSRRVRFGRGTTVSGWLGTTGGVPLGGQQVQVMTAPDNGSNGFAQATSVTTSANGTWSAKLPAGPSRLVQAVYGGASTVEPAASPAIKLLVPAKVKLRVVPASVPWGGKMRLVGRVLGGYIPAGSNILKLEFGDGPKPRTIGTPSIAPDGRFSIPVAWSSGRGVVHYWFAVATLNEADFAYSRGVSRRVRVTVGLVIPTTTKDLHHKKHRRHKKRRRR
jgi:hypothetical protein